MLFKIVVFFLHIVIKEEIMEELVRIIREINQSSTIIGSLQVILSFFTLILAIIAFLSWKPIKDNHKFNENKRLKVLLKHIEKVIVEFEANIQLKVESQGINDLERISQIVVIANSINNSDRYFGEFRKIIFEESDNLKPNINYLQEIDSKIILYFQIYLGQYFLMNLELMNEIDKSKIDRIMYRKNVYNELLFKINECKKALSNY